MAALSYLAFVAFPLGMAYAAASDLFTMTISNRLSVLLLAAFMVIAPFAGMDSQTLLMHGAAGLLVLVIGFACFAFGWIGGGDAKVAAVAALWLGWANMFDFISLLAILGGFLTMIILSYRFLLLPDFIIRQPWAARLHRADSGVPYGIALAAAALLIYPHTDWASLMLD